MVSLADQPDPKMSIHLYSSRLVGASGNRRSSEFSLARWPKSRPHGNLGFLNVDFSPRAVIDSQAPVSVYIQTATIPRRWTNGLCWSFICRRLHAAPFVTNRCITTEYCQVSRDCIYQSPVQLISRVDHYTLMILLIYIMHRGGYSKMEDLTSLDLQIPNP